MKHILIIGGTGFIGRHLIKELEESYGIVVLSRNPDRHRSLAGDHVRVEKYDPADPASVKDLFREVDGVINLSGENIGGGRWRDNMKARIMDSRLRAGDFIGKVFESLDKPPGFLLQASATGYYGTAPSDREITEADESTLDSFLTEVAARAEEQVASLAEMTRLVFLRTGIVLDRDGGALPRIALPFKMFVGGPVGSGKQWIPWIHIDDVAAAIRFLMEEEHLNGPVNLTAPHPARQRDFARTLGKVLRRPAFLPAPAFALKLLLGKERAKDLLLTGLRVIPQKLTAAGFTFRYPELAGALEEIYQGGGRNEE